MGQAWSRRSCCPEDKCKAPMPATSAAWAGWSEVLTLNESSYLPPPSCAWPATYKAVFFAALAHCSLHMHGLCKSITDAESSTQPLSESTSRVRFNLSQRCKH